MHQPHLRSTLLSILWLMALSLAGCDLFLEVPPPGSIEPDPMTMDMSYVPTCSNAMCTDTNQYRCRAQVRERCQDDAELACLLYKPLVDCSTIDSLKVNGRQSSDTKRGSAQVSFGQDLFVARGESLLKVSAQDLSSAQVIDIAELGTISMLKATDSSLYVGDTSGKVVQLDNGLKVSNTFDHTGPTGDAHIVQNGQNLYIAQGDQVRAIGRTWTQAIDTNSAPTALAVGAVGGTTYVYAAFGNKLVRLDGSTGKIQQEVMVQATIIDMAFDQETLWFVSQKTLAQRAGADLEMEVQSLTDRLCGTAISLSLHERALWTTDIGGCLSKYDLTTQRLEDQTIDLNNRPGAPATTNYRPHAPAFFRGLGYAMAKTTELVVFDTKTMQEVARQAVGQGSALASPFIWQDQVSLSTEQSLSFYTEQCPCQ